MSYEHRRAFGTTPTSSRRARYLDARTLDALSTIAADTVPVPATGEAT